MERQRGAASSLVIALAFLLVACEHQPVISTFEWHRQYLPLKVGAWIDYRVDSVYFDDFTQQADTFSFEIREWVDERLIASNGDTCYRLIAEVQGSDSALRRPRARLICALAERAEQRGAQTVVLLTYPPQPGAEWVGVAGTEPTTFSYLWVHEPLMGDSLHFDSTAAVIMLADTANAVRRRYSEAVYAKGIGLISIRRFDVETQFGIDSGSSVLQTVVGFGR